MPAPLSRACRLGVALLTVACAPSAGAPTVQYFPNPSSTPPRPFSQSVRVGHMLYLSGQIGTDRTGQVVSGGIDPETRQTLDTIRDALATAGSSMDRVVKCTVMLADMQEWGRVNTIYATYFPVHLPARSAIGANGLALGARVEIECWATVP